MFHILYNLDEKPQVPAINLPIPAEFTRTTVSTWAIRDENGRIMVAICFNMHIGDAWEHADDPRYAEQFSSFAYRMGINYIVYPMTH